MTLENPGRRHFLVDQTLGVGGVALAWLLNQDRLRAATPPPGMTGEQPPMDLTPRSPHHRPRAKAMISLFMHGGPSHMDLLDPKPALNKLHGKEYEGDIDFSFTNRASRTLMGSPFKFRRYGQSGIEVSELLPHLAKTIDDVCVIRSMHTGMNVHGTTTRYLLTGQPRPGRPVIGSWLSYGLGSENQDLPAFMVLVDPAGEPVDGMDNWSSGFMPPIYQGTVVRPEEPRLLNLDRPADLPDQLQQQNLALLDQLNRQHMEDRPNAGALQSRISTYELAARMQSSAREATDLSAESEATREMYGLNDENPQTREYGARCLLARRLVERGVRFVQLLINNQVWDHHSAINKNIAGPCQKTDKPIAALIMDLKARGLLESTLVHWGGEMGRLPVVEGKPGDEAGRDHNGQGFTWWLAGGGVKGGHIHGATDEVGHRAVEDPVTPHDFQATLLHLFGLDHRKLTFFHNGEEHTLTTRSEDARVVREILA